MLFTGARVYLNTNNTRVGGVARPSFPFSFFKRCLRFERDAEGGRRFGSVLYEIVACLFPVRYHVSENRRSDYRPTAWRGWRSLRTQTRKHSRRTGATIDNDCGSASRVLHPIRDVRELHGRDVRGRRRGIRRQHLAGAVSWTWYITIGGYTSVSVDPDLVFPFLRKKGKKEIVVDQVRAEFWCWFAIYIFRVARSRA
jgi:hypothetical protein